MSVSVTEQTFNRFRKDYDSRKDELARKGIKSFAGYITGMLKERMERDDAFARHRPVLEKLGYDEERVTVYVKDNRTGRVASVGIGVGSKGEGELHCDLDDTGDCVHVGFACAIPETYKMMEKLGMKPLNPKGQSEQVRG